MTWPIVALTAILVVVAGALLIIGRSRRAITRAFVVLGLVLTKVFLWIVLGISYVVGHTPTWLNAWASWLVALASGAWVGIRAVARVLLWAFLVLASLGVIITIVLVALFITGQYDAMAVMFFVLAALIAPFCIFFSWVKSWFGLRRARLLLALFVLLLFNAMLSMAMGSFTQLFSQGAFYALTGLAFVFAPVLAWWLWGRIILALAMLPLLWFGLLAENRPLLASIRGWFGAAVEDQTAANNNDAALLNLRATETARQAAVFQTAAGMTLALVKEDSVLIELKNPRTGNPLSTPSAKLKKGEIIAFTNPRPEVQTRFTEQMVEATVKDPHGLYTDQSPYKGLVAMRLIEQMGPYLDPPLNGLALAEDREFDIPDSESSKRLYLDFKVQVGDWLIFPDVDPAPAAGTLQMIIGTQTVDLSAYRHIKVEVNGKPMFVFRGRDTDTYKVFVEHYVPIGDPTLTASSATTPPPTAAAAQSAPAPQGPTETVPMRIVNLRHETIEVRWRDDKGKLDEPRVILPQRGWGLQSSILPGTWEIRSKKSGDLLMAFEAPEEETLVQVR